MEPDEIFALVCLAITALCFVGTAVLGILTARTNREVIRIQKRLNGNDT